MGFVEFVFGITFISIIVGGLVKIADRIFGPKGKASTVELSAAQDRIRQLESQVRDSHYQNEQLQKQLEWHAKLLETQDRFMKQLAAPSNHAAAGPGVARTA
ncbi:MAG TPA: hypothetical protein VFN74_02210 [Chloroflexota bacterium]|jgi:hypothetical protein|nr:hypothetical protein [Chloroflexota bacterium]